MNRAEVELLPDSMVSLSFGLGSLGGGGNISAQTSYAGPVNAGLGVSNVNYWEGMPNLQPGYKGYVYDWEDLKMRYVVMQLKIPGDEAGSDQYGSKGDY